MDTLPLLNKKFISVSSLNDIEEEKKFWLSKGALERIQAMAYLSSCQGLTPFTTRQILADQGTYPTK